MRKIALAGILAILLLMPAMPASALTVSLIEAFDYYDDNTIKFGDGFYSSPGDLDNDIDRDGRHNYAHEISGNFSLSSLSSDNFFMITEKTEGLGDAGTTGYPYFKINGEARNFYLGSDETGILFDDYFQTGQNTITFYLGGPSTKNLDDFEISEFALSYNAVDSGNPTVPEPATMLLFGAGLLGGAFARRGRKV